MRRNFIDVSFNDGTCERDELPTDKFWEVFCDGGGTPVLIYHTVDRVTVTRKLGGMRWQLSAL